MFFINRDSDRAG